MGKTDHGGGMWHEARKQEKKIRVMMVDHKRRADRRRQFYEHIKQDPTQFVRVYGRPCKIHLDMSVALAAEGPQTMMPWRGNEDIVIDRFDVRSHLDLYVEPNQTQEEQRESEKFEERSCNYERYRILVQNDIAGVGEDACLRQIHLDELYGAIDNKKAEEDKKKNAGKKAAISFTYEDSTDPKPAKVDKEKKTDPDDSEESDFDEVDLDNTVDIHNLTLDEIAMLNQGSLTYGMDGNDFYDNLELDKDEAEALRVAKIMEEEKAQYSGRKSRRERRAFKEKRLKDRPNSPPAYAARESPKYEPYGKGRSVSRSKSRSPDRPEHFAYINSFGGDCEEGVVQGPTLPPHLLPKGVRNILLATRSKRSRSRSRSKSPPSSRGRQISTKTRISRLKAMKAEITKSPTKSKSQSRSRSRSRSKNGSRSPNRRRGRYARSRSRSHSRSRRYSRGSRSRSRSRRSRSRNRRPGSRRSRSYSRSRSRSRKSRSRSRKSHSRSRSGSYRSRSSSYSRSRSSSRSSSRSPPKPVIKTYRRPSLSSNNSSGSDSDSDRRRGRRTTEQSRYPNVHQKRSHQLSYLGNKDPFNKAAKGTVAEKMKLKMQKALKRQFKADTKERQEKEDKALQKQQDREDELRAIAIQMRRREREKRHRDQPDTPTPDPRKSRSRSRSRSKRKSRSPRRARSVNRDRKEGVSQESRGDWRDLQQPPAARERPPGNLVDLQRRPNRDHRDEGHRRPPPPPPKDNNGGNWEVLQNRRSRERDTWREPRDIRHQRDQRDPRDQRDLRDTRDQRDQRDPRDTRDHRDPRRPRERDVRDHRDNRDRQDGRRSDSSRDSHHKPESPPRAKMPKLVDY